MSLYEMHKVLKKHLKPIGIKLLVCVSLYSMIIVHNLVNRQDGMWNGPYYFAGNWELSIGRWLIRYWDKLQLGIHVNPYTTIITLLLFVLGTEVLITIFKLPSGSWNDYLISLLFLTNMIVCISISYPYTSQIYGLAFLLSMLCVKCIIYSINRKKFVFVGAICLALVMGLYQSYLGCILLTILVFLILMVSNKCPYKDILRFLLRGGITGVIGLCFYELVLHLSLWFFKVAMSSYNGASDISIQTIVMNIVPSVKRAYTVWYHYLIGTSHRWNALPNKMQIAVFSIVAIYLFKMEIISAKKSKIHMLLLIFLILLIPIAVNITFILAPGSAFLEQQTAPLALMISMIVLLAIKNPFKKFNFYSNIIIVIVTIPILFGSIGQTLIEQEAMYEGTLASETIAQSVFQSLVENDSYDVENTYALVGSPCNNPMFYVTPLYNKANSYAKVGGPWWHTSLDSRSWYGIYHYRLGINLPMCDNNQYNELLKLEEVKSMPLYPAEGSIQEIDGIIVIKIS